MGILIVLIIIYPFLHHLMHDSIKYIDDVYTYGLSLNEFILIGLDYEVLSEL